MASYESTKTTSLKPKIELSGGGAWSNYSDGNDYTDDLLFEYKIIEINSDERIYNKNIDQLEDALTRMFAEFDKSPHSHRYPPNYAYYGVIIYMLFHLYPIPMEFLVRALFDAYENFISNYLLGPASAWFNVFSRLQCQKTEILLLNLALNKGTPISLPQDVIESDELDRSKLQTFIEKNIENTDYDFIDHLFLKYKKIGPQYPFQKFAVLPFIDPSLLSKGIVMMGYEGRGLPEYYIVDLINGVKEWKRFDPFETNGIVFLSYQFLYYLYGDHLNKIAKKDLKKLAVILRPRPLTFLELEDQLKECK
jgi:hypothetical protein